MTTEECPSSLLILVSYSCKYYYFMFFFYMLLLYLGLSGGRWMFDVRWISFLCSLFFGSTGITGIIIDYPVKSISISRLRSRSPPNRALFL
jgi:hypothetical protein